MYHGPVRVADQAVNGTVKIRLSFAAWKEGKVAPVTVEVPLRGLPQ